MIPEFSGVGGGEQGAWLFVANHLPNIGSRLRPWGCFATWCGRWNKGVRFPWTASRQQGPGWNQVGEGRGLVFASRERDGHGDRKDQIQSHKSHNMYDQAINAHHALPIYITLVDEAKLSMSPREEKSPTLVLPRTKRWGKWGPPNSILTRQNAEKWIFPSRNCAFRPRNFG